MGKASSAKKVARVARAGSNKRAGQRRPMGFPLAIIGVCLVGLLLVLFTRHDRVANAAPRTTDHWHEPYSIYTCVPDPSTPVIPTTTTTTTTSTTTTTATTAPGETTTTAEDTTTTTESTTTTSTTTTIPTSTTIAG